jgi:FtsP/CotA-like multicopper oxidase with cupredoxin domain
MFGEIKNKIKEMKCIKKIVSLLIFSHLTINILCAQKVVHYDLYVKDTIVNFTGKVKKAIAVNGQIPMPNLYFTEGDTAEIFVYNQLEEATSVHWHGLMLPNKEDGVPYITQMPIPSKSLHVYRFPIIQNGTHWYHSHSGLQELGMYGSFIINKRENHVRNEFDTIPSFPIILSEWTDYNPNNVHRMLHNASDWFAIKKNATQSYTEAIKAKEFKTKLKNEWKRMLAMDVSDIYYDKMEVKQIEGKDLKAGDKVRLRISNGGASSYFWIKYAGRKIRVIASDGNDVEPVDVDRFIIAASETYDIVVELPYHNTAFELQVSTEDRTKSVSIYIGNGTKQLLSPMPKLKYFKGMEMMNSMRKMNGSLDDMGMKMSLNKMDMNVVMYPEITGFDQSPKTNSSFTAENKYNSNALSDIVTLNYSMLRATENTTLPKSSTRSLRFELTGNMNRYVWSLDNKVLSETDYIQVDKGENLRIILYNGSMMRHPMHLHGHDFRLVNGQGEYAPMKNIIDIMPMETDTIEFNANFEGDWIFHCHILYHMMSGMGRVFSFNDQDSNPLIPDTSLAKRKLYNENRTFHLMFQNDFASNGNDGEMMMQNTRWSFGTEWRLGYNNMHGYETETHLGRYIGKMQWFMPFVGFDWRYREFSQNLETNIFKQSNTKNLRHVLSVGVNYTLPMLVKLQAEVFQDGNIRVQLMREDIPISKRLRGSFMVNTDTEYMIGFRYIANKNIQFSTHLDSDMGLGGGLVLNY